MDTLAGDLHAALAAVCPIHGVSVPDPADKATWVVWHADAATNAEREAADSVLAAFAGPA